MTNELTIPEEIRTKVSDVEVKAKAFNIKTQNDMNAGADLLHQVKQVKTLIIERKESITRPLMQSLSSIRDLFKPFEESYKEAEKIIKDKMLDYQIEEENRIENDKAKIMRRVEKGTLRHDTAIEKLENLPSVPKTAVGGVGKIQTRTLTKVRIMDESIIPREYMMPNLPKITEAILRLKAEIPGAERYEERIISSK